MGREKCRSRRPEVRRAEDAPLGAEVPRFVEVLQVNVASLRRILGSMMVHSDFMVYESSELLEVLRGMG